MLTSLRAASLAATSSSTPFLDVSFNQGTMPTRLTELGVTYTCSSVRYYWNGSSFQQAAINTYQDSHYPEIGNVGYLPEIALTESTKYTTDFSNALWVKSGGITRVDAASCIASQTASKLTAASSTDNVAQVGATSTNTSQISCCYVERGTATSTKIEVYNGTSLTPVADATINWSTGVVTSSLGTNFSLRMLGIGQNGGELYQLCAIASGVTSGHIRSFRIFPDISGGGGYCYLHHASCVASSSVTFSPIVTSGSNVTRGATIMQLPLSSLPQFNQHGFTLSATVTVPYHNLATRILLQVVGAVVGDRCSISLSSSNLKSAYYSTTSPSAATSTTEMGSSSPIKIPYTVAGTFKPLSASLASVGRLGRSLPHRVNAPSVTTLEIGNYLGGTQFSGYINRVRLYKHLSINKLVRSTLS